MKTNKFKLNKLIMTLVIFTSFFAFKMDIDAKEYGKISMSLQPGQYSATDWSEKLFGDGYGNATCWDYGNYLGGYALKDGLTAIIGSDYIKFKTTSSTKQRRYDLACETKNSSGKIRLQPIRLYVYKTVTIEKNVGDEFNLKDVVKQNFGYTYNGMIWGGADDEWTELRALSNRNSSNQLVVDLLMSWGGHQYKALNPGTAKIQIGNNGKAIGEVVINVKGTSSSPPSSGIYNYTIHLQGGSIVRNSWYDRLMNGELEGYTYKSGLLTANLAQDHVMLPWLEYEGYTFKGWAATGGSTSHTCSNPLSPNAVAGYYATDGHTYYACWESSNSNVSKIIFRNTYGYPFSEKSENDFPNCNNKGNDTECTIETGKKYAFPSILQDNDIYGRLIGWVPSNEASSYCENEYTGVYANYYPSGSDIPINASKEYYAIYEKTCVSTGTIQFLQLDGTTLKNHSFNVCSGGIRGQSCSFDYGKNYTLPITTNHRVYGKFIGWRLVENVNQFCREGGDELISTFNISDPSLGNDWKYYATFEKTCSSGGGSNPSVDVPGDDVDDVVGVIDVDGLCNAYNVGFHPTYSPRVNGSRQNAAGYKVGVDDHYLYMYQAIDKCNSNTYLAICYDPVSKSPTASTVYYKEAYVNPFDDDDAFAGLGLGGSYDNRTMSKAVEAFTLSMIQKHYDEINGFNGEANPKAKAVAAQIALRTFIYGNFVGFSNLQSGDYDKLYHYRGLFCTWSNNTECEHLEWTPMDTNSDVALNTAKSWWAESGAIGNTCLSGTCSGVNEIGFEFDVTKTECKTEQGKKKLIYEGTVKGLDTFSSNTSFIKVNKILCPPGMVCKFYIGNRDVSEGMDIRNFGTSFKFEVIGDLCSLSSKAEIGVKLDYFDPGDWHNAIVIKPHNSDYQRMLLINDSRSLTSDFVFGDASVDNRKCNCNDSGCYTDPKLTPGSDTFDAEAFAATCCNDPSVTPDDFARYCPDCTQAKWDMYCPAPPSSDEFDKLKENGADVNYYVNEGTNGDGDLDYDKCIMDLSTGTTKSDYAGNTYKLSSNDYCTIACKEDWEFTLPTYKTYANGTNASFRVDAAGNRFYDRGNTGRYFELNINKIQGTRTCITSDININKFKTDLEEKNKAVIDAYNAYLKEQAYKAQYDAGTVTNNQGCSCTTGSDDATCVFNNEREGWTCELIEDDDEETTDELFSCTDGKTSASDSDPYTKVDAGAYQYTQYRYDGTAYTATLSAVTYGSCSVTGNGSDSDNCDGTNCDAKGTDASDAFNASHGDDDISAKLTAYQTAVQNRTNVINAYNECSTFTNNYVWNPVIRYNYDETAGMSEENRKELNDYNYFKMKDGTQTSSTYDKYCKTSANDASYECQTYNDQASSSTLNLNVFESRDGVMGNYSKAFYENKNVMKSVTYSAAFEIDGVWYTENGTGKIVFKGNGTKPNGSYAITGGERGKVLPINDTSSMASFEETVFGMGSYRLEFSNIGQYQDGTSGGRLIGGTDGKGTKSVFAAMQLTSNNEGTKNTVVYSCSYGIKESQKCVGKDIILEIETIEVCPNNDCTRPISYVLDSSGDVGFFSRSISLNDMNPNNRELGGNWVDTKGAMTLNAIEEKGNAAYENPEYSYTLTPSGIASIRNDSGDYSKFELRCDDKGIKCESIYLSELDEKIGVTVNTKLRNADLTHQNSDDKFKLFAGTSWK